jgi:hypothetical protein
MIGIRDTTAAGLQRLPGRFGRYADKASLFEQKIAARSRIVGKRKTILAASIGCYERSWNWGMGGRLITTASLTAQNVLFDTAPATVAPLRDAVEMSGIRVRKSRSASAYISDCGRYCRIPPSVPLLPCEGPSRRVKGEVDGKVGWDEVREERRRRRRRGEMGGSDGACETVEPSDPPPPSLARVPCPAPSLLCPLFALIQPGA